MVRSVTTSLVNGVATVNHASDHLRRSNTLAATTYRFRATLQMETPRGCSDAEHAQHSRTALRLAHCRRCPSTPRPDCRSPMWAVEFFAMVAIVLQTVSQQLVTATNLAAVPNGVSRRITSPSIHRWGTRPRIWPAMADPITTRFRGRSHCVRNRASPIRRLMRSPRRWT